MALCLFFAKFFGIYFLLCAFFWTFFKRTTRNAAFTILNNEALVRFSGIISIAIGIALFVCHPSVTEMVHWMLIGVGVLFFVNGVGRLFFYNEFKNFTTHMIDGIAYYVVLLMLWIVGIYLTYLGFIAHYATHLL